MVRQLLLFNVNDFSALLRKAAEGTASIGNVDEDGTDSQRALLEEAEERAGRLRPLADLFTAYLMDPAISAAEYKDLFECLASGRSPEQSLNPELPQTLEKVRGYCARHHFYHWPLEFPELFGPGGSGGFSATVGNPPWDIVKPNSQEFFSNYDPAFRSYKKQEANRMSKKLMLENPAVAQKWHDYGAAFAEQSVYFREPAAYSALGKGDINIFKLFLEKFFALLRNGGRMGILVPSGIYTDQGCQSLRKQFFDQSRVEFLFCFSNEKFIFKNVHHAFRFVAFSTFKGEKTDRFKVCSLIDPREAVPPDSLDGMFRYLEKHGLEMSYQTVNKFSPDTLNVMEFKSQQAINTASTIYDKSPLIGNGHNISVAREFDLTGDYSKLSSSVQEGPTLYEGKMLWLFDCDFSAPRFWINRDAYPIYYRKDTINRTSEFEPLTRKQIQTCVSQGKVDLAPDKV